MPQLSGLLKWSSRSGTATACREKARTRTTSLRQGCLIPCHQFEDEPLGLIPRTPFSWYYRYSKTSPFNVEKNDAMSLPGVRGKYCLILTFRTSVRQLMRFRQTRRFIGK